MPQPSRFILRIFLGVIMIWCTALHAQTPVQPPFNGYRAAAPRLQDLVHTKLDVRFDYAKRMLYGKAWITLKPHAYTTDSLVLDAQGMDIGAVKLMPGMQVLTFTYDQQQLHINLPRKYNAGEAYTVYVAYTAKPDQIKSSGSTAITSAKGLYFINPDSSIKNKPVQVWTQGEQQASSAWFPTIDAPNQRMTTEISMTVPDKYITLSNGRLVTQQHSGLHLRTDTWKMEQPHAPYLVAMVVGDFAQIKDQWNGKAVNYYVEHKDSINARGLFHNTPAMLDFFSKRLGVPFPWPQFNQVIVRDYVSGAMENTTLVVHGDVLLFNKRQLLDANYFEGNVAHELFHQWFGDYVTTESWSNLTLNESFANFGEILWKEHQYGPDDAGFENYTQMGYYLQNTADAQKPLVRFQYERGDDVIDGVTYQKGGRILNMLRHYLGDTVFFKGVQLYLQQHAYSAAEVPQWRLALEEASGLDLNWFFNQWYYGTGHPQLQIRYGWDAAAKQQTIYLQQTQAGPAFTLPMAVDFYVNGKTERRMICAAHAADTFHFSLPVQPTLVNVDAEKVLLCTKEDHKTLAQFAYQYAHAPLVVDRLEALQAAASAQDSPEGRQLLVAGMQDRYFRLRMLAIDSLHLQNADVAIVEPLLKKIALSDSATLVQASAIAALAKLPDAAQQISFFEERLKSPSYSVQAVALQAFAKYDLPKAFAAAGSLEKDSRGRLDMAIVKVYAQMGDTSKLPVVAALFDAAYSYKKYAMLHDYMSLLQKSRDAVFLQQELNRLKALAAIVSPQEVTQYLLPALEALQAHKHEHAEDAAGAELVKETIGYLKNKQV